LQSPAHVEKCGNVKTACKFNTNSAVYGKISVVRAHFTKSLQQAPAVIVNMLETKLQAGFLEALQEEEYSSR
jgi:hypothetical protein